MKKIQIIGGGTVFHIRPHLALSAVAYGKSARLIANECMRYFGSEEYEIHLYLTKMANGGIGKLETNLDIECLLKTIVDDPTTEIIFLPVALCDFEAFVLKNNEPELSGKDKSRLKSRGGDRKLVLKKADKLISKIARKRPDVHIVGFKTTAGVSREENISLGQNLLNEANCAFVLANDIHKRQNIILGKGKYISKVFNERNLAIAHLVKKVSDLYK